MAHEFPYRIYAASARDQELINAPWRFLAGKLGNLNEQDLAEDIVAAVADIKVKAISDVAVTRHISDPKFTLLGGHYFPHPSGTDQLELEDTVGWQAVATTTISTGEDVLWLVGWANYYVYTNDAQHTVFPARVQFALEVDGSVQEDTVTGQENVFQSVPYELTNTDHLYKGYEEWDSRHVERLADASGMGPPARCVRLVWSVPVVEGSHTVRLVVRRCPQVYNVPNNDASGSLQGADVEHRRDGNTIDHRSQFLVCNNRFVAAVRCGGWQGSESLSSSSFSPTDLEDQDVLTATRLDTQRIVAAEDALNNLLEGDVSRGAVRHEHMNVSIVEDASESSDTATISTAIPYSGFENTAGATIRVNDNGGAGFDWSDDEGWCCIMADLEVEDLTSLSAEAAANLNKPGSYFVLGKLSLYDGAVHHIIPCTEGYMSNEVYSLMSYDAPGGGTTPPYITNDGRFQGKVEPMKENMSLCWVGLVADLPIQVFDNVQVKATTWNATSGLADAEVTFRRRNISIFRVRR